MQFIFFHASKCFYQPPVCSQNGSLRTIISSTFPDMSISRNSSTPLMVATYLQLSLLWPCTEATPSTNRVFMISLDNLCELVWHCLMNAQLPIPLSKPTQSSPLPIRHTTGIKPSSLELWSPSATPKPQTTCNEYCNPFAVVIFPVCILGAPIFKGGGRRMPTQKAWWKGLIKGLLKLVLSWKTAGAAVHRNMPTTLKEQAQNAGNRLRICLVPPHLHNTRVLACEGAMPF